MNVTTSGEQPKPLKKMFDGVPATYDRLNRSLTLGLDQRWRKRAVARCLEKGPRRILDLCTGTGDLVILMAQHAPADAEIVAADFSPGMLEVARQKAERLGLADRIRFVEANAAELPFEDGAFDALGIAFALRNLTFRNRLRDRCLAEMRRVLAPGGRAVTVETSQPRSAIWRFGAHAWFKAVVGPLGGLLSGNRPAYRYLSFSARHFYRPEEIADLLRAAGFAQVSHQPLAGGVAAIHQAEVD